MNAALLRLYQSLPYPARSLAASLHGYKLRRWRYGSNTDHLVQQARLQATWSPLQWSDWQAKRLPRLLWHAAKHVPYYREQWQRRRRAGDRSSCESLENWPILEKREVRRSARAFVADNADLRRLFRESTSGTTAKPLALWWDQPAVRQWYALFEAYCRDWYGQSRHDRWGMLGGQLVTPFAIRRPPFWVWNAGLNQLYLSSYHLTSHFVPAYVAALSKYRVKYLCGYTSSLYSLAFEMLRQGLTAPPLAVAITCAEPVTSQQRQVISAAFQCPVQQTYGMAEIVTAASECEHGTLHLWPSVGIVEVLRNETPVDPGDQGEFICTGLLNAAMPLIRYRVGDTGALAAEGQGCACGRTLPAVDAIEGRTDDLLYTADGRRIGRLDTVFKCDLSIQEAQIVQETLQLIRVRYVPTSAFHQKDAECIVQRLRDRMGDVEIVLDRVDQIERTARGKFKAVRCGLSDDEIQAIIQRRPSPNAAVSRSAVGISGSELER